MNIFASSDCPVESAQNLPTILVTKMITELAQILSTAHFVLDGKQVGYKPTHRNHPNCVWTRESSENYRWAYNHYKALCEEYTFRTGKVHKSSELSEQLFSAPTNIKTGCLTAFAMAMPDDLKLKGLTDPTKAYKLYLNRKFNDWRTRTDKRQIIACWGVRGKPNWID